MAVAGKTQGFRKVLDSTTSNLGIYAGGQKRLEFGTTSITEGGNTTAFLFGYGTSASRVTCTTASKSFIEFRLSTGATSGYNHGFHVNMSHTSTSTEFSSGRFYALNSGTVASGSCHALWATYEESTDGTNSGLSAAGRFTQTCAASVSITGTRTCLQLDATYPTSATLAGNESFIRLENVGTNPKKIPYFMQFIAPDTTDMFVAATNAVIDHALKISVAGVPYWIGLYDSPT